MRRHAVAFSTANVSFLRTSFSFLDLDDLDVEWNLRSSAGSGP